MPITRKLAESITYQKLLQLPLHETLVIIDSLHVLRVPGGWIYQCLDYRYVDDDRDWFVAAASFVPEVSP